MPLLADPRFLQSAVVGPVRSDLFTSTAAPEEAPSALDTASAISRQTMFPGAAYEFLSTARDPKAAPAPPGYDPLNDIAGYEDEAHRFVGADSPAEVQSIKQRISDQRADQDALRRAGIGGTAATIAFNLLDPTFLAAAAVPELAVAKYIRVSRVITGAARGAAGAAGYEAAMHAVQDDRTLGTSAINIGAGALLGGVLGPILQRRIPADVNTALRDAVLRDLAPPRSEVGAASASAPSTTLAQETIARGGRKLEAFSGGVPLTRTDEQVVLHSSSVEARRVLQELADVSPILEKHVEGIPAPTAVELLVDKHSSRVADFVDQLNKSWVEYRARVPSGERMSEADFRAAVSSSARNADEHAVPEVAESSKYLRSRVFDPLYEDAKGMGLLPDPQKEAEFKARTAAEDQYVAQQETLNYGAYVKGQKEFIETGRAAGVEVAKQQFATGEAKVRAAGDEGLANKENYEKALRMAQRNLDAEHARIDEQRLNAIEAATTDKERMAAKRAAGKARTAATVASHAAEDKIEIARKAALADIERAVKDERVVSEKAADKVHKQADKALAAIESKDEFRKLAASAAETADEHLLAQRELTRMKERGGLGEKVQAPKMPPVSEAPAGAKSYFMRMYDRNAIRRDRSTWNNLLVDHIMRGGSVELAEARSIAEDVTRNILGLDVGQANFNVRSFMPNAGPLHERTLNIPDNLLEKFLVNDPVKVAGAYVRELAPQIEVTKRFGDKDMTSAFQRVKDEYDVLRARETDSKKITKLSDNETQSLEALARVRDRIYGRAGRLSPTAGQGARTAVAIARGWRNFVASARLGVAALVSVPQDTARIMAQHGFTNTMGKVLKLASSADFRALSKAQARRLSASIEVAMSRRVTVAYDGAATEGWTQALANGVYKWSGLNHWTDFGRTLSVTLLEDQVLKLAESGKPLTGWTKTSLAQLGIGDEELKGIAAEYAKHGGEVDGTRVSGSANWDDAALSDRYDAALLKESRRLVKQPGAAHKVWWMDTETGKVVGQLKSFALSLPMSYAMPAAQMIGQGQAVRSARFVGYMMAGGAVAHVLRSYAAGKLPAQDPQTLAFEAFNEAGLAGVLPDLVSPLARRFGVVGESARYSDRNVLSTFGGPALGALGDAYDLAMNRTANGMSASDLHMLRRLLPYQNLWWLRRGINAVEGESAEQMGLKGAEAKDFGTRVIETTPLLPPNKRGGTGTGVVP